MTPSSTDSPLTSGPAARERPPAPPTRSRWAYVSLLRVPLLTAALFVLLPVVATATRASALLLGLFDVGGAGVWTVAAGAFMLSLTVMTTSCLVLAYGDRRCGVPGVGAVYPVPKRWYVAAGGLAVPTLAAVALTGRESLPALLGWTAAGLLAALALYELVRRALRPLDRSRLAAACAAWLARHPEVGAGYVDLERRTLLRGHRSAANLLLVTGALYVLLGQEPGPNGLQVPTLAYLLLLVTVACWALAGAAFFLDRYRVPLLLPAVALVALTGARGGSDHYFQLQPSWVEPPVSPAEALAAHPAGSPPPSGAILVAASGGGIQAAAWTVRVLTGLEEICRQELGQACGFARAVRLISSVSGGSVGAMYVTAAYDRGRLPAADRLERLVAIAEASSLEYAGWGLLYRDLFRPLYPHFDYADRGSALEDAWQREVDLSAPLESWRTDVRRGERPASIFNATISESGERVLMGTANPHEAPGRRTFEALFPDNDLRIVTAARLSAAFPYVSPAARADNDETGSVHFVDGGYYDLYGVASLIDWLDAAVRGDGGPGAPIPRVLVLQLRGAPPDEDRPEQRRGWFYQAYAPLGALLGARETGQLARNDEEVSLLQRALAGRVAVSSVVFQFCGASAPLSWHMTRAQKAAIDAEWAAERRSAGTRAVLDFLRSMAGASVPTAPVDVRARCLPTQAAVQ